MSGFFEELQRRKVYRVAAAYIIAAGFIIQIGSAVFPAWELPNWTLRLVVVVLLIGFPIALDSCVGLRRHAAGNSCYARRDRTVVAICHADRVRFYHFRWSRLLSVTARVGAQDRQVDCRPALSKPERRKRERLFRRRHAGRYPDESFQDR